MTTHKDMLYHLAGVPVVGNLPFSLNANYYFVDGANGQTGTDGLTRATALTTIEAAVTLMNARIDWAVSPWARRDVLVIAPGTYAENLTSLPYGCTVFGLGHDLRDAQNGVKIKPATGAAVDVDSIINTAFYNIHFETAETDASDRVLDSTIINNSLFHNCRFSGPAETATAVGVYTSDVTATDWMFCEFDSCDIGMDAVYVDADDKFAHNWLYQCRFTQCDSVGLRISTNLVGPSSIVERCSFLGAGQTMGIGIDDNSALLDLVSCYITATDPVQGCRSANGCYGNGSLLNGSGE